MITETTAVDSDINQILKESKEKFKSNLSIKLKKANITEKEFITFKLFFNGLNSEYKKIVIELMQKKLFTFEMLWRIMEVAERAKRCSNGAIYNRNKCCIEVMEKYKTLLTKMSKLSKELNINNSLELSILYSYLLWNGYLSKTRIHEFKEYDGPLIMGLNFTDITNGIGVCRNYTEMLKDFLEFNGCESIILENYSNDKIQVDYVPDIKRRKTSSTTNEKVNKEKKPNHVFNLIEDNGLYIYDCTNLALYELKNKNKAELVNGKGKNIVYPYYSYEFCYSKNDEKMLDRLFAEDDFSSPYTKSDFISISEVNLELIRNSKSLLEDFYTEAKQDILGISEETKKVLAKIK